jgi:hypothetical protein
VSNEFIEKSAAEAVQLDICWGKGHEGLAPFRRKGAFVVFNLILRREKK